MNTSDLHQLWHQTLSECQRCCYQYRKIQYNALFDLLSEYELLNEDCYSKNSYNSCCACAHNCIQKCGVHEWGIWPIDPGAGLFMTVAMGKYGGHGKHHPSRGKRKKVATQLQT